MDSDAVADLHPNEHAGARSVIGRRVPGWVLDKGASAAQRAEQYSTPWWVSRPALCQGSTAIRHTGPIGSPAELSSFRWRAGIGV